MGLYAYVVIVHNSPDLASESTLLHNKYKANKKYAFIQKNVNKDHSENICFIDYSNDLEDLQRRAAQFNSWYNYPLNLTRNMQGYIRHIK